MAEYRPVAFGDLLTRPGVKPTTRDNGAAIATRSETHRGGWRHVTSDRALRLPWRLAMHQVSTGAGEYRVRLGEGRRTRLLLVSVTDDDALDFLRAWAARDFLGGRELRRAERRLERRREREQARPTG
jgi:hypothetical protein